MTIVRRIIAAAVVSGTLAVIPISVIASETQTAGGIVKGGVVVSPQGGQGGWPFKP